LDRVEGISAEVSPNVSAAAALTRNKDEHFWVTAPDLPRGMVKLWSVKK
jgi:hypothetical protein